MTDSTDAAERARRMSSDRSRGRRADVDALMPNTPSNGAQFLTLFASLFSVGTGIALFTASEAAAGVAVPLLSVAFVAAGVLFWFGAALGRHPASPETAP